MSAQGGVVSVKSRFSHLWEWLQWCPVSADALRTVEKKIMACLKSEYRGWYVDIGSVVGTSDKIWTVSFNGESPRTPIVLLHGLASGVALWCLNYDALASKRPVYAIDLLGFARSSRPTFSKDAMETEQQFVRSVEEWRREMKLDKIILLGHSMGGFLAASYALAHPQRVKHLILADPWGFPERPPEASRYIPLWVRAIAFVMQPFNPLWPIRLAGPFGEWLIEKTRPDIMRKFTPALGGENINLIPQYIFQCNAQNPTGEAAFRSMMSGFGWAKNPMIKRIHSLPAEIPITIIYGSRSWVQNTPGETIRQARINSYVNVQVITGAGHHVYADKSEVFNKHVVEACELTDSHDIRLLGTLPQNRDIQESDEEESEIDSERNILDDMRLATS